MDVTSWLIEAKEMFRKFGWTNGESPRFCTWLAMYQASGSSTRNMQPVRVCEEIFCLANGIRGMSIPVWNDTVVGSKGEVLEAFDRAITFSKGGKNESDLLSARPDISGLGGRRCFGPLSGKVSSSSQVLAAPQLNGHV